jgi:hypothetical protein
MFIPKLISVGSVVFTSLVHASFQNITFCTGDKKMKQPKWDSKWDFPDEDRKANNHVVHQIIMIRHGQYVHDGEKGDGTEGKILTPLGHEQAKRTGDRLHELISNGIIFPVKSVYYSTMIRANQTWKDIESSAFQESLQASKAVVQPCSMIREGSVYPPEPPSMSWQPSELSFLKGNARVSMLIV